MKYSVPVCTQTSEMSGRSHISLSTSSPACLLHLDSAQTLSEALCLVWFGDCDHHLKRVWIPFCPTAAVLPSCLCLVGCLPSWSLASSSQLALLRPQVHEKPLRGSLVQIWILVWQVWDGLEILHFLQAPRWLVEALDQFCPDQ